MSGLFTTEEGTNFYWDTFLDIYDRERDGYIRLTKGELIEFLEKSDFLKEMGSKIIEEE